MWNVGKCQVLTNYAGEMQQANTSISLVSPFDYRVEDVEETSDTHNEYSFLCNGRVDNLRKSCVTHDSC